MNPQETHFTWYMYLTGSLDLAAARKPVSPAYGIVKMTCGNQSIP
jgi:hypothetical protein